MQNMSLPSLALEGQVVNRNSDDAGGGGGVLSCSHIRDAFEKKLLRMPVVSKSVFHEANLFAQTNNSTT